MSYMGLYRRIPAPLLPLLSHTPHQTEVPLAHLEAPFSKHLSRLFKRKAPA